MMPEEQPPIPESQPSEPQNRDRQPSPSEPPTPATPSTVPPVAPARPAQSQTLQTLQQLWRTTQPKLQVGTIRVLKTTIQLLESAVTRLETGLPNETSVSSATPAEPIALPQWLTTLGTTLQQGWQRFWQGWQGLLPTIRGILPGAINQRLASDRALSGVIAGVLLLTVWLTSSLIARPPAEPVAIAPLPQATPAPRRPAAEQAPPKPKPVPGVKVIPSPAPTPSPSPTAPPAFPPPKSPQPTASPTPAVTPLPSPKPTPAPPPSPPPLKLTPEQTLIAQIQDQVAAVSDQYVNGLIQSVQANFRASRLMVKLGEGWYTLMPTQQDSLANDVLKRAQQLNFVKLEIVATNGDLLARSPVIGAEMVVLQRSRSSSPPVEPIFRALTPSPPAPPPAQSTAVPPSDRYTSR